MKDTLEEGLTFEFEYRVLEDKMVPNLYPESKEFQEMPEVLATGYLVGLIEWACIQAINPHIDWPKEQTLGIHVDLSHDAPTPPRQEVKIKGKLEKIKDRKLTFSIVAKDEEETISKGTHKRYIINKEKFNKKAESKTH
ncbi:thioesterase [archaeon SCG-AAA382B04]|nr:thioesterase [archaeon SCG-AAA382B04]